MLVKISDLKKDLLSEELSIVQRGLLITILLLKEEDPKVTLAKVKVKVNINQYKEDLIKLCNKGYLEWSGYKAAVASLEKKQASPTVIRIITFMNNLYKRNFDPHSESNIKLVTARLKNFSEEEILKVVANRFEVWKSDFVMNKYLHPETIFRESKFKKYYEEALRTKEGLKYLTSLNNVISHNEEITLEIAEKLLDNTLYDVKFYNLETYGDSLGKRLGTGSLTKILGKDLKRNLKSRNRQMSFGNPKEFIYLYQEIN